MEEVKVEVFYKKFGESIQTFLQDYDTGAELIEEFVECSLYYSNIKPENIDIIIAYLKSRYYGSEITKRDGNIYITTKGTYSNACMTDLNVSGILNVLKDYTTETNGVVKYKYYIKTTAKDALRWYLTWYLTSNSDNHRVSQIIHQIMSESRLELLNDKPKTLIEITHAESEKANPSEYEKLRGNLGGSTRKHKYHHIQNRRKSITNKRRRTTRTRK
jgi:hypothetical protein